MEPTGFVLEADRAVDLEPVLPQRVDDLPRFEFPRAVRRRSVDTETSVDALAGLHGMSHEKVDVGMRNDRVLHNIGKSLRVDRDFFGLKRADKPVGTDVLRDRGEGNSTRQRSWPATEVVNALVGSELLVIRFFQAAKAPLKFVGGCD